ncbi:MAG: STAS/SEC14 domain-containing protein [Pseudomonadota bacterium]|nr:STAS/SEC14 domain-containing protein [Pseudomonadota bacterium]
MIAIQTDRPDQVIEVTASGEVTAEDYESVLIPAVEDRLRRHEKIRILYHLTKDFSGFSAGALWDDTKVGLGHLRAWERIALVTDVDWIGNSAKVFGFLMPSEVRVFPTERLDEARDWIVS